MERLGNTGQSSIIKSLADLKVGDQFEEKDDTGTRRYTLLSKNVRKEGQGTVRIVRTKWKRARFYNDITEPTESIVDKLWFNPQISNRHLKKLN